VVSEPDSSISSMKQTDSDAYWSLTAWRLEQKTVRKMWFSQLITKSVQEVLKSFDQSSPTLYYLCSKEILV